MFLRFGNIADVSTMPREQAAVIKYQREDDARKALEAKTVPFHQVKIELSVAGKVHSFEEDARQEAERKEIMEKKMAQRQKVTDRKKQVQQNLTLLLTALLELKSLATSEESKALIKEKLDEVRARLDKAKNADSEDDLNTEPNHDISTDMEVSSKGTPLDMKSLGDTFKVDFSSNRPMERSQNSARFPTPTSFPYVSSTSPTL